MTSQPLPPCLPTRHTSDAVEPPLRREAWRDIAHWLCDFMPSPDVPLDADMHFLRSDACIFGSTRSSAYEMTTGITTPAQEELVVVALIQAGRLDLNASPGDLRHMGAGGMGLFMPNMAGHFRWSHNARQAFIDLPRREAMEALGGDPGNLALAMTNCALAPVLASQLRHLARMARQPHLMDGREYAALLESTRMLTLLTLRNLGRRGLAADDLPDRHEDLNRGRHAAALRIMEHELHRHALDPEAIARGAGCSRTRLYEAFAAQGATVMDTLRDMRLQRARAMIEQTPKVNLGALSWQCGFADQSGFSKLFKARFGLLPSEWHRQAWQASGSDAGAGGDAGGEADEAA